MTRSTDTIEDTAFDTVALDDPDFLRRLVQHMLQHFLEAEMTAHLGAARYERSDTRQGHRNGYKPRQLHTRVASPIVGGRLRAQLRLGRVEAQHQ